MAEQLHHPAYGADTGLLQGLKDKLSQGVPGASANRRIYVPRKHNRSVSNEHDILPLLTSYGFESIDTDNMSIEAQISAFQSASAIIAPHGAALTNLLFCQRGTKFLELFPAFGGSSAFYIMALALGLDYTCYIDDKTFGPNKDDQLGGSLIINNTANIDMDVPSLETWLKANFG